MSVELENLLTCSPMRYWRKESRGQVLATTFIPSLGMGLVCYDGDIIKHHVRR